MSQLDQAIALANDVKRRLSTYDRDDPATLTAALEVAEAVLKIPTPVTPCAQCRGIVYHGPRCAIKDD